jgi:hypothetical protein
MLIVDKPGPLETKAQQLLEEAERCHAKGLLLSAEGYRQRARRLMEQARALRGRLSDGLRKA